MCYGSCTPPIKLVQLACMHAPPAAADLQILHLCAISQTMLLQLMKALDQADCGQAGLPCQSCQLTLQTGFQQNCCMYNE